MVIMVLIWYIMNVWVAECIKCLMLLMAGVPRLLKRAFLVEQQQEQQQHFFIVNYSSERWRNKTKQNPGTSWKQIVIRKWKMFWLFCGQLWPFFFFLFFFFPTVFATIIVGRRRVKSLVSLRFNHRDRTISIEGSCWLHGAIMTRHGL